LLHRLFRPLSSLPSFCPHYILISLTTVTTSHCFCNTNIEVLTLYTTGTGIWKWNYY
jgi:hypothetical protein